MDPKSLITSTYNSIADKYTQTYFDDTADKSFIDQFTSYLPKNAKVLDVGCGPGQWTKYLLSKGFYAEGIDASPEMIKIAKHKVPKGKFTVMDMGNLEFKDNNFDGILAAYSLIHIPSKDIIKTLEGFSKVLNLDGLLGLAVQKGASDKTIPEPFDNSKKIFVNFFDLEKLIKLLEQADFKILFQQEVPYDDPEELTDTIIYVIAKKNE